MARPGGGGRRRLHARIVLVSTVVALAACGGGDGLDDLAAPTTEPSGVSTDGSQATFEPQPFSVGAELWHGGFHVQLGDGLHFAEEGGAFRPDELTYLVAIEATFENEGEDPRSFDFETVLMADGSFFASTFATDLPSIPGGLSGDGTFLFQVEEGFEVDSATLVVGSGGENRSEVPLGGGEATTIEPTEPAVSGELSMELIDLVLTSAELRGDRPVDHTQVEEGKRALTLQFDAVSRASGNWTIRADDFALSLPGGLAVAPEGSGLETLAGSDEGTTTPDLYLRFLVDDPPAGEYTLRFTAPSWFVGDDGAEEGTVAFTLT